MRISCWTRKQGPITTSSVGHSSLKRLLLQQFRPHWRWFAAGTVCAILTALAGVSYGGLIKIFGDHLQALNVADAGINGRIWLVPGLVVLAACVRAVSNYAMTLLNNTGIQRALVDISKVQYAALIDGDYARLSGSASGGFVSRFINDLNAIRDFGLRLANSATKSIVTVVGALCAMLWMDWQLALVLLLAYPLAFGPVIALGNRVRKRAKTSQEQLGEVTSLLSEGFQSARAVAAYGLEDYQKERAGAGFLVRAKLYLKVLTDKAAVDPILEIAGGVAIAGVLGFSVWRISQGAATIGDFLGFITLIGVAAPEIRALGNLNASAQEAKAACERFYDLLDAPRTILDGAGRLGPEGVTGEISFQNVSFGYGVDQAVLDGLSFTVKPGETVALVGPSGAGKSTVFNLLLRLFDPKQGAICLDGKDLKTLILSDVRAAMALVEQEPALFDDTVAANIAIGNLGADEIALTDATKAAYADEFINNLPDGYQTLLGERGNKLSGGQRQRIALARAVLRDAPILLLDEATSALDASSERKVQTALEAFGKDRTVIVIAHRLTTVKHADRILVLDAGRLVETGTHDDLLNSGGLYARLAKEQLL